jgi:hypothetical protein
VLTGNRRFFCSVALFEWNGEQTPYLQPKDGAEFLRDQPPEESDGNGPAPSAFVELAGDAQYLDLAEVEFHAAFTISFAVKIYSWRRWCRFFDAQRKHPLGPLPDGTPRNTDWIQILNYRPGESSIHKNGLAFWMTREGYPAEECLIESGALELGRWQYITCSVDRLGIMRVFIDGVLRSARQAKFAPRPCIRDKNTMGAKARDCKEKTEARNRTSILGKWNLCCLPWPVSFC